MSGSPDHPIPTPADGGTSSGIQPPRAGTIPWGKRMLAFVLIVGGFLPAACKQRPAARDAVSGRSAGELREFDLAGRFAMTFRWIPAEAPQTVPNGRRAIRDGFWMAETETTVAVWQGVMGALKRIDPPELALPISEVSWHDCLTFIGKLRPPAAGWQFSLPTEREWEHACRAGSLADFYAAPADIAWLDANSGGTAHPVGLLPANAWGLRDMHGNVAEWCLDATGPNGRERGIRGGSWDSDLSAAASARNSDTPSLRINRVGFRLVITRTHS